MRTWRRTPKVNVPGALVRLNSRLTLEINDLQRGGELTADAARVRREAVRDVMENYMIYATVGRDRKKLDMEWVEKAEASIRDTWRFHTLLGGTR